MILQVRMLRSRKATLDEKKQELEDIVAQATADRSELEARATSLEVLRIPRSHQVVLSSSCSQEKTNTLVADNTVLAMALQAVEVSCAGWP